jgi:hypothetical protein
MHDIAKSVYATLCSARRVYELRRLASKDQDVPLENIILFNHDALILHEYGDAIRRGDVGSILNVLSYWMVMFRGTGKMPKYTDALFHLLARLKQMDPKLRFEITHSKLDMSLTNILPETHS